MELYEGIIELIRDDLKEDIIYVVSIGQFSLRIEVDGDIESIFVIKISGIIV